MQLPVNRFGERRATLHLILAGIREKSVLDPHAVITQNAYLFLQINYDFELLIDQVQISFTPFKLIR